MEKQLILRGTPVHCTINEYGFIWNLNTQREQRPFKSGHYKRIKVRSGGGKYLRDYIHRLVAQHFIGEAPEPNMYVNHIDGDTHNNHVSNLEWVTPQQNIDHKLATYKIGTIKYRKVTCPQCCKVGGINALTRYHFDNCKFK